MSKYVYVCVRVCVCACVRVHARARAVTWVGGGRESALDCTMARACTCASECVLEGQPRQQPSYLLRLDFYFYFYLRLYLLVGGHRE